jgi:hypothetical protein
MPKTIKLPIIAFFMLFWLTVSYATEFEIHQLRIEKGEIVKEEDRTYWVIPVTLTNNSGDTLKYLSMSCSWQDFYSVSDNRLQVEIAECDKNIPRIISLPPKSSMTVKLRLLANNVGNAEIIFNVRLNIIKADKPMYRPEFDRNGKLKPEYIIGSNTIAMRNE